MVLGGILRLVGNGIGIGDERLVSSTNSGSPISAVKSIPLFAYIEAIISCDVIVVLSQHVALAGLLLVCPNVVIFVCGDQTAI